MAEWRRVGELKRAPIRHRELPLALIARIESLRATLDEVYPQSMAEWLDGFQRDATPEHEVIWWERLAQCYVEYNGSQDLNVEGRRAAFNVILKLLLGSAEENVAPELAKLPPTALGDILGVMRRISKEQ